MDAHDIDARHMREALALAERGWGHVSPNPMVGAVITDPAGAVIGRGWYEGPRGEAHAEIRALREAGDRARGATMYCSLEPCDHHGATAPCTEALIAAGVRGEAVPMRFRPSTRSAG
jgi:diaminohydroxyphosphoribosylaminopyrimidine deaminase/5-amino-6-(5-phosphoribosylamino)uracil reductase